MLKYAAHSLPLGTRVRDKLDNICYVVGHHLTGARYGAKFYPYVAIGYVDVNRFRKSELTVKSDMDLGGYPARHWETYDDKTYALCNYFTHIDGTELLSLATFIAGQKCTVCASQLEHKEFTETQRIYCDFCKVQLEIE